MNLFFKRYFEIFIVIIVSIYVLYSTLYMTTFDSYCNNYSGNDEKNFTESIVKLAKCKDNLICEPFNIEVNNRNQINNWSCFKKEHIFINKFNNFKDSIIK